MPISSSGTSENHHSKSMVHQQLDMSAPGRGGRSRPTFWVGLLLTIAVISAACGATESTIETAASPDRQEDGQLDQADRNDQSRDQRRVKGAALDAHTHVMSPELTAILAGPDVPASTAEDLVARLDEAKVKQAVVLSLAYFTDLPDQTAVQAENNYTAAEVAKYPDRLIGFCGIDALRPFAIDEIERCDDQLGLTGVKLHLPSTGLDVRDEVQTQALNAVFDEVAARDLPVLMHAGAPLGVGLDSDGLINLATVIATHPTVRLTFAHCTNDADRDEMETWIAGVEDGAFNAENLYVDTSSCLEFYKDAPRAQKELMVWRLRKWGIQRVLFGSDYLLISPVETPAEALKTLRSYPFTNAEINTILSNNGSAWLNG